jgi:predicted phage terminase large subunit-like protein
MRQTAEQLNPSKRAALESAVRESARANLIECSKVLKGGFQVGRHTQILAAHLHYAMTGQIKRLIVTMPPRHGKSLLVSQIFPCFILGHRPTASIIQSGYSADIALEHSRKARDIFTSQAMRFLFPNVHHTPGKAGQNQVAVERQAAGEWGTVQGGTYRATGVGGGITGFGADYAIIDDPVKDRKEADSLLIRNRIDDWFNSTLYTRLSPNGVIILVMTRWNVDDQAGRLIRRMNEGGEKWTVLHLPAIDDDGEALWPQRWPVARLLSVKKAIGKREWESLYQGRPTPASGTIFQKAWWDGLNRFDIADKTVHNSCVSRIQSWDTAESVEESAAYTSCLTGELSADYKAHITDSWRDRMEFPDLVKAVIRRAESANRDGKLNAVLIENKSSGVQLIQTLNASGPEWLRPLIVPVNPAMSKELRGQRASVWCENGSVLLPHPSADAPWLYDFEQELFTFPGSLKKDQVDTFSQLVWYWENMLAEGSRTTIRTQ